MLRHDVPDSWIIQVEFLRNNSKTKVLNSENICQIAMLFVKKRIRYKYNDVREILF